MAHPGCELACTAVPLALLARGLPRLRCHRAAERCEQQMPPVPRATARPHASLRSVGATRVAVHEYPPLPSPPLGRPTATASEHYVSACARVCWTRAARGCALSPLASALVFSPSFPRPSV